MMRRRPLPQQTRAVLIFLLQTEFVRGHLSNAREGVVMCAAPSQLAHNRRPRVRCTTGRSLRQVSTRALCVTQHQILRRLPLVETAAIVSVNLGRGRCLSICWNHSSSLGAHG